MSILVFGRDVLGTALELLVEAVKGSDYGRLRTSSEPAERLEAVDLSSTDWTPSEDFGTEARSLKIGTGGNVKVDASVYGTGVTLAVVDGELLPVRVTKVYKTGTTAATIVALAALALLVAACCCPRCPPRDPRPRPLTCEGTQIDTTCADGAPDGTECCLGPDLVGHCGGLECLP